MGKANTQGQVVNHIKTMMANLDADALVSVKENYFELVTKMNTPDNSKFCNFPFTTITQVYLI